VNKRKASEFAVTDIYTYILYNSRSVSSYISNNVLNDSKKVDQNIIKRKLIMSYIVLENPL